MDIVWLKVPAWENLDGMIHGFLGRKGGKSLGHYSSLNLSVSVGDNLQTVKDNLCDLKKVVGAHDLRIVTMTQRHQDHIAEVTDHRAKNAGEADGMITKEREIFLGVLTADCVPILFAARSQKVTAVVHAGWRGTMAGLPGKMIRHLGERYQVKPEDLEVALGPAIGPCCYEIKEDVSKLLLARWKEITEQSLQERNGKLFLDLRKLSILQLDNVGIPHSKIFTIGPCTSCASDDFFSYRCDSDNGDHETGRQLSFIGWR